MGRPVVIRRLAAVVMGMFVLVGFTECGPPPPGPARWRLENTNATASRADVVFDFLDLGHKPLVGDWDGNGTDTPGGYASGQFFLRNANSAGGPNITVTFRSSNTTASAYDVPVVGDWNGDGRDTIGVWNRSTGRWYLRDSNTAGAPNLSFVFDPAAGQPSRSPVVGDWNGDGRDTIGIHTPNRWQLRDANSAGAPTSTFDYGGSSLTRAPVVGDWDGNGVDTVGVRDVNTKIWMLRNSNNGGLADLRFSFGAVGYTPITGDWDGNGSDSIGMFSAP